MRAWIAMAVLVLGLAAAGLRAGTAAPARDEDPWGDDEEWIESCERDGSRREVAVCEVRVDGMRAPRGAIRVDGGENGGVAFSGWGRDSVAIHARIRVKAATREEARKIAKSIRIVTDGAEIRAEGPPSRRGVSWTVGLHLAVPARSDLVAEARNGPIAVEHVSGRIEVSTHNGPLALSDVGGDVRARAVNGPLEIRLTGSRWEGEGLDAETTNGPVELSLPEDYSARLTTGTANGPIDLDIPISVRKLDRRNIVATLGSGGAPVRAVTQNGPLSIRTSRPDSD